MLQEDANYPTYDDGAQLQLAPVSARWTAPDGTPRTGLVVPTAVGSAGTSILIETDTRGTPLAPAVGRDAVANAVLAAFMVMVGVAAVATFLILLLQRPPGQNSDEPLAERLAARRTDLEQPALRALFRVAPPDRRAAAPGSSPGEGLAQHEPVPVGCA